MQNLQTEYIKNISISADYIQANDILSSLSSLDNRLSGITIEDDASKDTIISVIKQIIQRFS